MGGGRELESRRQLGTELTGPFSATILCLSHSFLPSGSGLNQPELRTLTEACLGFWPLPWLVFSGPVDLERP